jgi:hypothetical protein
VGKAETLTTEKRKKRNPTTGRAVAPAIFD